MKKLLIFSSLLIIFSACAGGQIQQPAIPAECENSLIYRNIPAPVAFGGLIQIAVYELAKNKAEYRPFINAALTGLLMAVQQEDITPAQFQAAVDNQVLTLKAETGVELLIVANSLKQIFTSSIPMDPCDRALIVKNLTEQLTWLSMLENEK